MCFTVDDPDASEREAIERGLTVGVDLAGATQTITATAATKSDADLLHVPKGAPLLRVERITTDIIGRTVLRQHRPPQPASHRARRRSPTRPRRHTIRRPTR